jgi:hypothetical protein
MLDLDLVMYLVHQIFVLTTLQNVWITGSLVNMLQVMLVQQAAKIQVASIPIIVISVTMQCVLPVQIITKVHVLFALITQVVMERLTVLAQELTHVLVMIPTCYARPAIQDVQHVLMVASLITLIVPHVMELPQEKESSSMAVFTIVLSFVQQVSLILLVYAMALQVQCLVQPLTTLDPHGLLAPLHLPLKVHTQQKKEETISRDQSHQIVWNSITSISM